LKGDNTFFTYEKLSSVAIIAGAAGPHPYRVANSVALHDTKAFPLYNQAENWHISCVTNSTGVRFKAKKNLI
jgi:hypothetical protein